MKFGKQLQLGTYEPWKDYYLSYNRLKRIILRKRFIAEKEAAKAMKRKLSSNDHLNELTPLKPLSSTIIEVATIDAEDDFFIVLQEQMDKIGKFFVGKLAELRIALDLITSKRHNSYRMHHTAGNGSDVATLRDIYVQLAALRSYCDLNKQGLVKIIKKHDKILEKSTLDSWVPVIDRMPFSTSPEPLQLMEVVTSYVSRDKLIEWERFATDAQTKENDDIFPSVRIHGLVISVVVFAVSLMVPLITPDDPAASRCMSLLLFTVSMWVTEAIPYFATALLIPPLIVFLRVLKDGHGVALDAEKAATFVLNHMVNHTTMLLLGGYTISTAFSRCQLELRIAAMLQSRLGNHPKLFILAVMFLGLFLSMWISNHTAPILCAAIILPIVRDLPTDSKFSQCLLLGLAFACNFGGMMTPISSLQNALAVSYLEQAGIIVTFGQWICVATPFCFVCIIMSWCTLIAIINPDDVKTIPVVVYERSRKVFGKRNVIVLVLSLAVITLFATSSPTKHVFGDIGIVALCYVAIMFGSGMLNEVDFNSLSWHTLFLLGGGNALGNAVASSGLLEYISNGIIKTLPLEYPFLALLCIVVFAVTVATFVSHTVASIILMPIIASLGVSLHIPEVVVIGSAFAGRPLLLLLTPASLMFVMYVVSAAMALPFSSFPNVNSLLMVDDLHSPYLGVNIFIRTGLPLSLFSILLIVTLGYVLINAIIVQ